MVPFEELQELWQNQPQPQPPAVAAESRGMAAALRRFRRRQYYINGVKLGVMILAAWLLLSRRGPSMLTFLGLGLFLVGMIFAVVTDWRIQSAIARLDFTRPSAGFVDATLERLRNPNAPFRRTGWLCIALVAAGFNLLLFRSSSAIGTVLLHIGYRTAVFAALFAVGLRLRAKRYTLEYKPLVERLEAMKAALEDQAQ